jgi:hypothetical protein
MSNIRFVAMNSYVKPEIKEVANKGWVEYGDDNNYFQYLIDRYNGSPTNNAIINGIIDMVYGKGLGATDASRKPDEYAMMMSLFTKQTVSRVCSDFKMMGNAAFQVIYNQDHSKIVKVEHIPVETLRAERANEKGDIPAYYYAKSWDAVKARKEEPVRIDAFGMSNNGIEILYIKPYKAGYYYYAPTDYQGSLPYADLEEEVANYHINNIKNGLAPSMLVNFNNGIPTEEDQTLIERRIADKFSGSSNAGRFILAFNDNKELAATIEPVQLSDASDQYQFLSTECTQKIMVGHRVTSPMLLGIKDNSGLGNNADELKTASILFDNIVIRPLQEMILDAIEQILSFNQATLNIYFKTLQPLEFKEEIVAPTDVVEESTGIEDSSFSLSSDATDAQLQEVFDRLAEFGEEEDLENWDLVDERPVDYEQEAYLDSLLKLSESASSYMANLAKTGEAFPNAKSEQDGVSKDGRKYKIRYSYAPNSAKSNSRDFCKKMVNAKKVYRKEDIERMGKQEVNAGFGPRGAANYDIWLYKGGARCHHFWMRKTYLAKAEGVTPDAKNPNADISVNQARKAGVDLPKNDKKVATRPVDMPNEGFLPKSKK